MKRNAVTIAFLLILLSVLGAGCKSTTQLPPIEQMAQPPSIRLNYHIASSNESLYVIAWRYGVDVRELAQRNRLAPPYHLRAGQKIMLADSDANTRLAASRTVATPRGVQVTAVQDDQPVVEVASATPAVSRPAVAASSSTVKTQTTAQPETVTASTPTASSSASNNSHWLWPTNGRVITMYSANDPVA